MTLLLVILIPFLGAAFAAEMSQLSRTHAAWTAGATVLASLFCLLPLASAPFAGQTLIQRLPWLPPHVLRGMYREGFNVGLHTGNVMGARVPIVALDVDGEGAGDWIRRNIPKSPVVSLSAKGEHWLYRYPRGVKHIGNRVKVRVGSGEKIDLDIRADRGNLVIPP